MKIIKTKDYSEMSEKAASLIAGQILLKPNAVLGLATGSTPEGLYEKLVKWNKEGYIDFKEVHTVNLDEYKGIAEDNPQSYRYFMHTHLFSKVNINAKNTYLPSGITNEDEAECKRYERVIESLGGVDLQLLGLGNNGHIGFNEPRDSFTVNTNCVKLDESTIEANKRFFDDEKDVPRYAYTMGIGTIMKAKKIVLVVSGKGKAGILERALCGPVTPKVPASILQLHPDVTVVADQDALSLII